MAREIEERDVHPEMYEDKSKSKLWPWKTTRVPDGYARPEYTYPVPDWVTGSSTVSAAPPPPPRRVYIPRAIGGPCAGARIHGGFDRERVEVAERMPPLPTSDPLQQLAEAQMRVYIYERVSFNCNGVEFLGYAFVDTPGFTPVSVLEEVCRGYNPGR